MMVGNMLSLGPSVSYQVICSMGTQSQSDDFICGKPIPNPVFIVLILISFSFGGFMYRILQRGFGCSAKCLAPLCVLWIIGCDLHEHWVRGDVYDKWTAVWLAPVFGLQDAMTVRNGFGALPWCTTNNVVTIAFGSADILLGGAPDDEKSKVRSSAIMFSSMVIGSISGAAFCSYTHAVGIGLMVIAVPFGCLLWVNEIWFGNVSTTKQLELAQPLTDTGHAELHSKMRASPTPRLSLRRLSTMSMQSMRIETPAVEPDLHLSG
eukprot:CAMPEP_0172890902 /NCGR_PEP_ID=MMETSP1075-20121228/142425_1 /TAXON_ID=2916 /ORGANISM="Ceratium fusus, Strain PA161109" /LENGTH=263 /DNA_ID=CAMNT_0013745249 /DNA_START=13 /DNA_END=804 /DNA_ORIENTATION=-